MEDLRPQSDNPALGCVVTLAMCTVAMILVALVSFAVSSVSGLDLTTMPSAEDGAATNMLAFKWLQIVSAILIFVLPSLFFSKYKTGSFTQYFRARNGLHILPIVLAGLAMAVSYPLLLVSMEVNSYLALPDSLRWLEELLRNMEDSAADATVSFLRMDSIGSFLLNMLMVAVIPAVGEELLFRGVIQKLLQKLFDNAHVAIFITAILFSAMHFQFYGFLPRWIMGIILGYLFYWSGNIWYPIIAHFLNNGFQVLMVYLGNMPLEEVATPELPPLDLTYLAGAVASLLCIGLIFKVYRNHFLKHGVG